MKLRPPKIAILPTGALPGPVFIAWALLLVFSQTSAISQIVKLEPLSTYESSLRQYYLQKFQADKIEFEETTKKKWWYYLPSVGIQFGLPSVQLNTGVLAQIDRDRQQKKTKVNGLYWQAESQFKDDLLKLRNTYRRIQLEQETEPEHQEQIELESKIHQVYADGYARQEIKPVDFLNEQVKQNSRQIAFAATQRRLALLILDLELLAHYPFPKDDFIPLDSEMECIMKDRKP